MTAARATTATTATTTTTTTPHIIPVSSVTRAMPTTRLAPLICAIWPTVEPVAPAALQARPQGKLHLAHPRPARDPDCVDARQHARADHDDARQDGGRGRRGRALGRAAHYAAQRPPDRR